jgi:hypothetical protein
VRLIGVFVASVNEYLDSFSHDDESLKFDLDVLATRE